MPATSSSFSSTARDLRGRARAHKRIAGPAALGMAPDDIRRGRPPLPACPHAWIRMDARRIGVVDVELAIDFGRAARRRGALIYIVGDKEVGLAARQGVDLRALAGVHVVCSAFDGTVKTVYRNRELQLQPGSPWRPRRGSWLHCG